VQWLWIHNRLSRQSFLGNVKGNPQLRHVCQTCITSSKFAPSRYHLIHPQPVNSAVICYSIWSKVLSERCRPCTASQPYLETLAMCIPLFALPKARARYFRSAADGRYLLNKRRTFEFQLVCSADQFLSSCLWCTRCVSPDVLRQSPGLLRLLLANRSTKTWVRSMCPAYLWESFGFAGKIPQNMVWDGDEWLKILCRSDPQWNI